MAYPIIFVTMKFSSSKTRIMAMFWPPLVSFLCQILRLCVSAQTEGNTNTSDICPSSLELHCFPYADNNGELGCGYCHFNCTKQHQVRKCGYSEISISPQTERRGLSILSTSQEKINVVGQLNSSFDFDDLKLGGINFYNLQNNTLYICDEKITLPDFEFYPCGSSRKIYRYKKDDDVKINTKAPAPAPGGCSIIQFPEPPQQGILLHYHLTEECARCIERSGECQGQWQDGINSSSNFTCTKAKRNLRRLGLIAGLVITGSTIIVLALYAAWRLNKYKFSPQTKRLDSTKSDLEDGGVYCGFPMIFNYTELSEATGNFNSSRVLGDGGFGIVYRGKLRDGREVAVKRLYERNYNQVQQFKNEVEILTSLRHPNLVVLYGCTSRHSRELLLIYEYIPNGTVADHLHGEWASSRLLTWPLRMKIAIETASALSYLHASDIIHRDVKTNNILLDNNFCVKVADFGLSRLFPTDVSHISTAPQGTPGYLDPVYHKCYQLTEKSDVYSFGVVLLELISSLAAVDIFRPADEINLSDYALPKIENHAFHELIDPELGFESDVKVRRMTIQVAELAFLCLQQKKEFRPSMNVVLETLENIDNADYEDAETEEMSTKEKITARRIIPFTTRRPR